MYKTRCLLFVLMFLVPAMVSYAQDVAIQDSSNQVLMDAAVEIMTNAGTCAFITVDDEGRPRVRAMDPFLPTDELIVWFGSNPLSRKIKQIRNNPRVSLYYLDSDQTGYVMIHGLATLVDDDKSKVKWWKEKWNDFYPEYPNNYILIKVEPVWMEVISTRLGVTGDEKTWTPPSIKF
ncbi:MAG: pyridoxamine 5'-phosphate oxidase family protein [Saprospiraceae bacterium]|nr:pyridoxamine 5'-phosphate oxidase family protein [Saprospiraceae bacterium]